MHKVRITMRCHFWKILLIAFLADGVRPECETEYQRCQTMLLRAVRYLQAEQIDTYCRESSSYIQCVETSLTECDPLTYNKTALLASTRGTRDIYCPSGSNPGYTVCLSRLTECQVLYTQAIKMDTDTEYCSLSKQYAICILRDLSPCHQSTFNVTSLTLEISTNFQDRCSGETESCFNKYVECQRTHELVYWNYQNSYWNSYCLNSQIYLNCITDLETTCGVIYTVTSSQSADQVTEDRTTYCSLDGSSPSFHTCRERYRACTDLIYITGDITTTVVSLYCSSLDKYKGCISRDLISCLNEEFRLAPLQTVANANWTTYCYGFDVNGGNFIKGDIPRTIFTAWIMLIVSTVWHT